MKTFEELKAEDIVFAIRKNNIPYMYEVNKIVRYRSWYKIFLTGITTVDVCLYLMDPELKKTSMQGLIDTVFYCDEQQFITELNEKVQ